MSTPSWSDDTNKRRTQTQLNDQFFAGDVFAGGLNVVEGEALDVVGAATAVGNTAAAHAEGADLDLRSRQELLGEVESQSFIQVGEVTNSLVNSATSFGNALSSAVVEADAWVDIEQSTGEQAVIAADAQTQATGDLTRSSTAGFASANAASAFVETGALEGYVEQETQADVGAWAGVVADDLEDFAQSNAVVTANAVTAEGWDADISLDVEQRNSGAIVQAGSNIFADTGDDVISNGTAASNSIAIHNEGIDVDLRADQTNEAFVQGESVVTLDRFIGQNASTAFGVGNTALVSNFGFDGDLVIDQDNRGPVEGIATFTGGAGQPGSSVAVNAAAFGNAASGQVITAGGGAIDGQVRQSSIQDVTSQAQVSVGGAGQVFGTSTAVGNSATIQTRRGN
ncbi:MAG: holdfast anchor protein HfaD [Maricaulaceae bacterium]